MNNDLIPADIDEYCPASKCACSLWAEDGTSPHDFRERRHHSKCSKGLKKHTGLYLLEQAGGVWCFLGRTDTPEEMQKTMASLGHDLDNCEQEHGEAWRIEFRTLTRDDIENMPDFPGF